MNTLIDYLKEIVPTYTPSQQVLKNELQLKKEKPQEKEIDILIADDEKGIRNVLSKFLEGRGYNTLLASNGREAINIIKGNNISVAIIDIRMPGFKNGLQVLKQIRRLNKNIKVMILTGFGTEKTRRFCRNFGAFFLEKPFELVEIKKYVEDILKPGFCIRSEEPRR